MGAPYNPPTKNASFETYVSLRSFASPGSMQANPTLAAGDVKAYFDGVASTLGAGASANLITLPTVVGTTVVVKVALGSTEMNFDNITVVFIDQTSPKEWEDLVINIVPGTGGSGGATAAQIWDYLTSAISTSGSIGKLLTDDINATISSRSSLDAAGIRTAVGLATANLDTQLDALPTAGENADAIWDEALSGHLGAGSTGEALDNASGGGGGPSAATIADAVWDEALSGHTTGGTAGKALGDVDTHTDTETGATAIRAALGLATANLDTQLDALPTANENADALLDRSNGVETGFTLRQALRLVLSGIAGKISGAGTANVLIRDVNDSKNRISAVVDASGNRSTVTKDVS